MILVVNQSTLVKADDFTRMVAACETQLRRDLAPSWARLPWPVRAYDGDLDKIPPTSFSIVVLDSSDQAGALGYHSEEGGRIFGRVFAGPTLAAGGSVLGASGNSDAVSVTLSHEVCEAFVDPYACYWSDGPERPEGSEYALEVCDPVEADTYDVGGVLVSSFVLPDWFNAQMAQGAFPVDHLGRCSGPFAMTAGGYLVVRSAPGQEHEVFANEPDPVRRASRRSPMARSSRRGISVPL